MKKPIEIPITKHFDVDPENYVGKIILYKDIPADAIITFGYEIIEGENKKPTKLKVIEAALVDQRHFKNYLDALPDSCIQAGGHVKGKGKRCQLCSAQV